MHIPKIDVETDGRCIVRWPDGRTSQGVASNLSMQHDRGSMGMSQTMTITLQLSTPKLSEEADIMMRTASEANERVKKRQAKEDQAVEDRLAPVREFIQGLEKL